MRRLLVLVIGSLTMAVSARATDFTNPILFADTSNLYLSWDTNGVGNRPTLGVSADADGPVLNAPVNLPAPLTEGVYYLFAPNLENAWFHTSSLSIFQVTAGGLSYNSTFEVSGTPGVFHLWNRVSQDDGAPDVHLGWAEGETDLATFYPNGSAVQPDGKLDYYLVVGIGEVPVPEPTSAPLLGLLGVLGVAWWRRSGA